MIVKLYFFLIDIPFHTIVLKRIHLWKSVNLKRAFKVRGKSIYLILKRIAVWDTLIWAEPQIVFQLGNNGKEYL